MPLNTDISQGLSHRLPYKKAILDQLKLLFRKKGDVRTINGVRVGDKGRLEAKEKPVRLCSQLRSHLDKERYKEPTRDEDYGCDLINDGDSDEEQAFNRATLASIFSFFFYGFIDL